MKCKCCGVKLIKDPHGAWQHKPKKYYSNLKKMKEFYHSIPLEIRKKCLRDHGSVTKTNLVKMGYLQK